MEDLNETIVDEDIEDSIFYTGIRKKWYNNIYLKCFSGLVCICLFSGIIYINVKCGSFTDNILPCHYPNYCPNKIKECDGSM